MGKEEEFISRYSKPILYATDYTKIFPSVKIAQAALETGWGKSIIGNNLFGIKATGKTNQYWNGDSITGMTTEYLNGIPYTVSGNFRKYKQLSDSIRDHNLLITENSRYKTALSVTTPEAQSAALKASGYATDPNYATKLISIINQYNLKRFDKIKNVMKYTEISLAVIAILLSGFIIYKRLQ